MSEMPPPESNTPPPADTPPAAAPVGTTPPGMEPHRGVLVLVLGIVSFICCVGLVTGPLSFFFGKADLAKMNAGQMDPAGQGMTKAGFICGIIGFSLNALWLLFNVVMFIIGMIGGATQP